MIKNHRILTPATFGKNSVKDKPKQEAARVQAEAELRVLCLWTIIYLLRMRRHTEMEKSMSLYPTEQEIKLPLKSMAWSDI